MQLLALAVAGVLSVNAHAAPGRLFQRMIVVVLENTDYDEALRQPFMAGITQRGAHLASFDAVAHPSQPNYIAMISGSTHGVSTDRNVNLDGRHLGDLLEEKDYDWRAYAEGYPGNCFLGAKHGDYVRKHVPFLSFRNVQRDSARCAKVVEASRFYADAAAGTLPEFSLYIPDLRNDGHDTTAAFADRWLRSRFEKLLADPSFMEGTLFVLTFDENDDAFDFGRRNQILTTLYGPMVRGGSVNRDLLTHYSLLKLAEDNWALDRLTRGDAEAGAIGGIWE
jgi:hypothetical protein